MHTEPNRGPSNGHFSGRGEAPVPAAGPAPVPATATALRQRPSANRAARARQLWLKAHRWIGLSVGLLFVLIGLTGSVLVFDHAIDEWLHPEILLSSGSGNQQSIQQVVAAAEQAYAQQVLAGEDALSHAAAHAHSVSSPRVANGVWTVWFSSGASDALKFTAVHVDPYTAAVTGQRVWGEDWLSWIYRLHFRLLAGETGATIVGLTGIVLMVSILSGICLWWPLWKNSWRAGFAVRRGARFNYDLHKLLGVGSAGFLLVIAFTGVYMEFPDWVKPVVTLVWAETPEPTGLKSEPADAAPSITADRAVEIAQQRFPHAEFCHLHPPERADGVYEIALLQPGEIQSSFGRTQIFIDRFTGEILTVRNPSEFTAADAFFAWQFPLHNGEAFGLLGRWVVFFVGLSPAVLYVSGFLLWWRKRAAKQQQQGKRPALTPTDFARTAPEQPRRAEPVLTPAGSAD